MHARGARPRWATPARNFQREMKTFTPGLHPAPQKPGLAYCRTPAKRSTPVLLLLLLGRRRSWCLLRGNYCQFSSDIISALLRGLCSGWMAWRVVRALNCNVAPPPHTIAKWRGKRGTPQSCLPDIVISERRRRRRCQRWWHYRQENPVPFKRVISRVIFPDHEPHQVAMVVGLECQRQLGGFVLLGLLKGLWRYMRDRWLIVVQAGWQKGNSSMVSIKL